MRSGFWAWSFSEAGANPRWLSPVHPRPYRGSALGTFLPPLERPPTDPNRSRPTVRSACVRRSGVVRGSMGEAEGAGISFFERAVRGERLRPLIRPGFAGPPSPTRGEGEVGVRMGHTLALSVTKPGRPHER